MTPGVAHWLASAPDPIVIILFYAVLTPFGGTEQYKKRNTGPHHEDRSLRGGVQSHAMKPFSRKSIDLEMATWMSEEHANGTPVFARGVIVFKKHDTRDRTGTEEAVESFREPPVHIR